jgi:hypothetical protein
LKILFEKSLSLIFITNLKIMQSDRLSTKPEFLIDLSKGAASSRGWAFWFMGLRG